MAGIEQLEIHSKSYIVRWVKVDEGYTISWSVQPHKKSINFGIVKHPGSGATTLTSAPVPGEVDAIEQLDGAGSKNGVPAKKDGSTAQEQLASKGFIPVKWHGHCEADKVSMGTCDVGKGKGGMFGLVFDNTFSKTTGKTATFVLLTYPTNAPPHATHLPHNALADPNLTTSKPSPGKASPRLGAVASDSVDSLHSHGGGSRAISIASGTGSSTYHTGVLLKRGRKKGQGYARRYFSLDYSSCTLSYYFNRTTSALRGAIPLSLAAISADERRREISIDSGAEIWHLRAQNAKDFNDWARALEKASRIARGLEAFQEPVLNEESPSVAPRDLENPRNAQQDEDREWQQVEALVSRMVGTRDALRRLVKDMGSQKNSHRPLSAYLSPATPSTGEEHDGYFAAAVPAEKRPFWKRKTSAAPSPLTPTSFTPAVSSALAVPAPITVTSISSANSKPKRKSKWVADHEEKSTQDHCAALLSDLDNVVAEFTALISNSKRRRFTIAAAAGGPRRSLESSISNDEFFDAEAGETENRTQVMIIDRPSEEDSPGSDVEDDASFHSSSSISSVDEDEAFAGPDSTKAFFPAKPKTLHPLPVDIAVERRATVPAATVLPPSLIAFVRKNVGKDLSTISMPVSANEPLSLLQRSAEQLEYAQLLDTAATKKAPGERLLYVTAFAISQFSGNRVKDRAIRKPFNPLLGETFELLRTDSEIPGGFRLLVEKVTHRPVRLAMQADAANWSFTQSPAPTQKFWGKSAELITEGKVRIALRLPDGSDEYYSWSIATMFLRNVVMGEKYVEPVGNMTVHNDSTGAKAEIEFKSKGMFSGRGEDVQADAYGPDGSPTGHGLMGTWTSALKLSESGKATGPEIWRVGELVPNAPNTYGFTKFAASLNELTEVEKGRLAPTDSRLRPDQRLAEQGSLDEAEAWKTKLEEAQRSRRRALEEAGEEYKTKWFVKVEGEGDEEVWRMKGGKEGYWEERGKGDWEACENIFNV